MATKIGDSAPEALAAVLGPDRVRDAAPADAVNGVRPRWVAVAGDTQEVAAALRVAAEHGLRVIPHGSRSKIGWGSPPTTVDLLLDVSAASGVLEHAAGDLVIRARAGTPIAEVRRVAGRAGQQLSIESASPTATVGGVIATGASGPSAHLYGPVRDLLIGITVVRADGTVTVSGGKVVKNVAGYDLGKLYTGSYGTLGVITEAIFRLHPRALEHRWISTVVDDADAAGRAADAVRHSQAMPTAIEVDCADGRFEVCAQLEGRPATTHTRAESLAETVGAAAGARSEVLDHAPAWWGSYPFDPCDGIGLRLGVRQANVAALLAEASESADRLGQAITLRGPAGAGIVHGGLPADTDPAAVAELLADLRRRTGSYGGYAVLVCAPPAVHRVVEPWGPIPAGSLALMRRIKDQFDPEHRLCPGRFVGGI